MGNMKKYSTVGDLIEILENFNPNEIVVFNSEIGMWSPPLEQLKTNISKENIDFLNDEEVHMNAVIIGQ